MPTFGLQDFYCGKYLKIGQIKNPILGRPDTLVDLYLVCREDANYLIIKDGNDIVAWVLVVDDLGAIDAHRLDRRYKDGDNGGDQAVMDWGAEFGNELEVGVQIANKQLDFETGGVKDFH